jgi:hypothetical protein
MLKMGGKKSRDENNKEKMKSRNMQGASWDPSGTKISLPRTNGPSENPR